MPGPRDQRLKALSRKLRSNPTSAEGMLWSVLRGRRLCGVKFRRQFSIPPFIVDFACVERGLVVEVDGGYHDAVGVNDVSRQRKLEAMGWTVIRFSNSDVMNDADAVAVAIAKELRLMPEHAGREFWSVESKEVK